MTTVKMFCDYYNIIIIIYTKKNRKINYARNQSLVTFRGVGQYESCVLDEERRVGGTSRKMRSGNGK